MTQNPFFDGRTPKIQALEKQMNEAAAKRDNIAYVFACNNLGRKPDYRDSYEQGVAELMQRRKRILENKDYQNFIQSKEQSGEPEKGRRTKINYAKFLKLVDSSSVNPYNAFDENQYSEKMRILKEAGYDKLVVAKGESRPIGHADVSVSRVLHAFSNTYQTAMNWAEKQMSQEQPRAGRKNTQKPLPAKEVTPKKGRRKADKQQLLFPTEGRI